LFSFRGNGSNVLELREGESAQVSVYTRSNAGASFTLSDADSKKVFVENVEVKHLGSEDVSEPSSMFVLNPNTVIKGPLQLKLKAVSNAGRFTTNNYLIAYRLSKG
jgi:hypothetical protein